MQRLIIVLYLFMSLVVPCFAEDAVQTLDEAISSVKFSGQSGAVHLGGHFTEFSGKLSLDPEAGNLKKVSFNANWSSVSLDELGGKERVWLEAVVSTIPDATARFTSESITVLSANSYLIKGVVNVFGQSKDMKFVAIVKSLTRAKTLVSATLKDKGVLLPVQIPGLGQEVAGTVSLNLVFKR